RRVTFSEGTHITRASRPSRANHPTKIGFPLLLHGRHANVLACALRHAHEPEWRRVRDLVIGDVRVVAEAKVRPEEPVGGTSKDNHRAEPALARFRELGAHTTNVR